MKSGTINVTLTYAGRSVPKPMDENDEPLPAPARIPFTCLRCGHSWKSYKRSNGNPKQCPECHSPYWNRKKKKFKRALHAEAQAILSAPKLSMSDFEKEIGK